MATLLPYSSYTFGNPYILYAAMNNVSVLCEQYTSLGLFFSFRVWLPCPFEDRVFLLLPAYIQQKQYMKQATRQPHQPVIRTTACI